MTARIRVSLLAGLTLAAILAMRLFPRIPQSESYHNFADQRALLGVPNFLNVVSNLPFLVIGIAGLFFLARPASGKSFVGQSERLAHLTFFLGVALTCFGSAYYHLSPSTPRLVWDRLPMTIAFMSLLASVIGERINAKAGLILLPSLLMIGVGSVIYWYLSEQAGAGDLRPYVLVQFYSGVAIVLIAIMFAPSYTRTTELVAALLVYALAKTFELLDYQVLNLTRVVSGHTLKHLAAAVSVWCILHMLKHRTRKSPALAL
jgi:Ceramidase